MVNNKSSMVNSFSRFEASFPPDYRRDDIANVLRLVKLGKFCQLICLPGGGKATVLKLLAYNGSVKAYHLGKLNSSTIFLYLNLLELPNLEQATINKFLLLSLEPQQQLENDPLILSEELKTKVSRIVSMGRTLVLLFDHFDEFQNRLDKQFFQTLRTLRSIAKYRFSVVFATRRDLRELIDDEIRKDFYDFFVDNSVYMKLYDKSAMEFMFSQIEKLLHQKLTAREKDELIRLTSGHTKLLKVCTETVLQEKFPVTLDNLLGKTIVKASLFELWLFLTSEEQQTLIAVSNQKPVEQHEGIESLILFSILKKEGDNLAFTIPLFESFVQKIIPTIKKEHFSFNNDSKEITKGNAMVSDLLSPKEYRLLCFLLEQKERVIERDEIISVVWQEQASTTGVTEQALDQLIFRLRQKIEDNPNQPTHLQTVKGRGFRFSP